MTGPFDNNGPVITVPSQLNNAPSLGLDALASLLDASLDGIVVVDQDRRYLYANPAACRVLGHTAEALVGRDFLMNFPEREHEEMLAHFTDSLVGQPGLWQATVLRPNGEEREIEYSNMRLFVGGVPCGAAILRDVTNTRRLEREGAAFAEIASSAAYGGSVKSTLDVLCRRVVEATSTVAAAVALDDPDLGVVQIVGCYGHTDEYITAINKLFTMGLQAPTVQAFESRRASVTRQARQALLADPVFSLIHEHVQDASWDTVAAVPLIYGGAPKGVLIAYYPAGRDPGPAEISFLSAISDQAAVAVENARLLSEVQSKAATEERARIARELHDSVTQALFSINLTARSAEVSVQRDAGKDTVKKKLSDLRQLTQGALAEMRALIFELRPGALEEEGLVQALRKHAAAVQGRHLLEIEVAVEGGEFPRLRPSAEEALYRIAQEALHNVVKHAKATHVRVVLSRRDNHVSVSIRDNGKGFDTTGVRPGHMGLGNMRQRADALGGECSIASAPGTGTRVTVDVPLHVAERAA